MKKKPRPASNGSCLDEEGGFAQPHSTGMASFAGDLLFFQSSRRIIDSCARTLNSFSYLTVEMVPDFSHIDPEDM